MIELLLWPVLPVAAESVSVFSRAGVFFKRRRRLAAVGAALGGVGWLAGGLAFPPGWGVWLTGGMLWAFVSALVLWSSAADFRRAGEGAALAEREDEVGLLEKERVRLRHEVDKSEREKTRSFQVYSLAKALTESLSGDHLAQRFGDMLGKLTGAADYLLYLSGEAGGPLELKFRAGAWDEKTLPSLEVRRHPQWVSLGGQLLLQAPLWDGEELLGLLWIRWSAPADHPSIEEIEGVLEQLLIGFQKARLFAKMESLSRVDGLTVVLRRQVFMETLQREFERAKIFKTPFSFLIVDVDHFKRVNDTHGHPAGDAVLARLGRLLKEGVYETDTVGRYGGEEFSIVFPRAEPVGVRRKAENLRWRVESETFTAGWERLKVTISVGLAHYPADGATVKELMEAADRALYAAKERGRNRLVESSEVRPH